jgi:tetraacyldisaccharide 4'-kinase
MREPAFWYGSPSFLSRGLAPLGALYGAVATRRMAQAGQRADVPVLCIGNYHLGGAGKTPTTMAVAAMLQVLGERPVVVSRGYGGRLRGPVRVDPAIHGALDVGDEPLMMSYKLPVVVARDRVAGAAMACSHGASVILLDDGFQNPALAKDVSLIVIDSRRGVGNGEVFPAGPLRAKLSSQVERTSALMIMGGGSAATVVETAVADHGRPVFHASLKPDQTVVDALRGKRLFAFAGIGDPRRFFSTLRQNGLDVVKQRGFPDHHVFTDAEMRRIAAEAASQSLALVTTEKDMMRIRGQSLFTSGAIHVTAFGVALEFEESDALKAFLLASLAEARAARRADDLRERI